MKHTLLYFCILLSISVSGFGQKQVTDFQMDISISAVNSNVWGRIKGKIYLYVAESEVWSLTEQTGLWEFVGYCPKSVISSRVMIIEDNFYFVSYQEGGNWRLNKFNVNTGHVENEISRWGSATFYKNGNILYFVEEGKLKFIDIADNFRTDVLLEGHIEFMHNETEESSIIKVNRAEDYRKFHVYSLHDSHLLKIDSFETNGYNNTPQYSYKVLKKTNKFLLFERTNQTQNQHARDIFLTNLHSGKTDFKYTAKYRMYKESDKYYSINDGVVHVEMCKPERAEKLSFKFHVFKTNGEIDSFEKKTEQYNRIWRQGFMSAPHYSNISDFVFSDSSLYFLSNKYSNVLPYNDSLVVYINRLNINTSAIQSTPLEIKLNDNGKSSSLITPTSFSLKISDKTLTVFPASFTDDVSYFDLNLKRSSERIIADELHFHKLSETLFIKLDSKNYTVIDEKKQQVLAGHFPEKKTKSSGFGPYGRYRIIDENIFMLSTDKSGYPHLSVFDGETLKNIDLGQLKTNINLPGHKVVNGCVSLSVSGEDWTDIQTVIYNLKKHTLIRIKTYSEYEIFSKREFSPFVLSNGSSLISVSENGEILNSLSAKNHYFKPVHQFPDGNLIIRDENTGGLYDSKFSKNKTLPLASTYPFAFSSNGTLAYFFDNQILKSVNSSGEIQTVIQVNVSHEYNFNPYGKYVFVDHNNRNYYILDTVTSDVKVLSFDAKKYYGVSVFFVHDGILAAAYKYNGGGELYFYNIKGDRKYIKPLSPNGEWINQQYKGGTPYNKFLISTSGEYSSLILWENQEFKKVYDFKTWNTSDDEAVLLPSKFPNTMILADFKNDVYFEIFGTELEYAYSSYFAFKLDDTYVFRLNHGSSPQLLFIDSKTKEYSIENIPNAAHSFKVLNNKGYFVNYDEISGYEVWSSDGSMKGTVLAFDINPGGIGSNPGDIIELKNNLFVFATTPQSGLQLWQLTDNEPKDDKEDILLATENPTVNFSFYPNPTQDYLNVSSTSETENTYKITVFGTDGKVVSEQNLELPQRLDLSGLKTGVYLINVSAGQGSKTFRVVKK